MSAEKHSKLRRKNHRSAYAWAFFLPLQVGLLLFILKQVTPFGSNSILCMDLWGQYTPMYIQQAHGGADGLFYSWNGALGMNVWAQNAYYGNMLSFLVLRLLPIAKFPAAIGWISLLKLPAASVACLYFLRHHFGRANPVQVGGAVSYSLCAYMLAFFSQCMWTDTLIYAPLVLCGVDRLIHEKRSDFYVVWLALAIFSNFYVGFALCIFTALYFLIESVATLRLKRTESGRFYLDDGVEWLKTVGRFALFSLLAGGLSAFVSWPVWLALGNSVPANTDTASLTAWHADLLTVLRNLIPGGELRLAFADKGANLATGIGVFLLVPLYFCNRSIRKTERILNGLALAFLTLSVNNKLLDYIWHGFHFPNQLAGRWTFLFSLFVVLLGCRALMRLDGLTLPRVLIGGNIGYFLLLTLTFSSRDDSGTTLYAEQHILFFLLWLAVIALTLLPSLWKRRGLSKQIVRGGTAVCLCVVVLCQVVSSGWGLWTSAMSGSRGMPTSDHDSYVAGLERMKSMGDAVKATNSSDWYRAETNGGFTFNPSMIGDYHGMSAYSSTMNYNTYELLRSLGNRVYALNISTIYNLSSVVQNSLFGVRYYMDNDMSMPQIVPQAQLVNQVDGYYVWENPTALSVAFAVPGDPTLYEPSETVCAIRNQKTLLDTLCGCDTGVYQPLSCELMQCDGVNLAENNGWENNWYTADVNSGQKFFRYIFRCEASGPVYMEQNFSSGAISVSGENNKNATSVAADQERFKYVGTYETGDTITVTVPLESASGHYGVNLYRLDEENWDKVYHELALQQMIIEKQSATNVSGTINMIGSGYVFTSIPQDGGWTMLCDGHPVETVTAADGLLTAYLPAGTHNIEFRYAVPGFKTGLIISVVSLILAVLFACPGLRKRLFRRAPAKPAEETADVPAETPTEAPTVETAEILPPEEPAPADVLTEEASTEADEPTAAPEETDW